jgi:hypothetical protein
LNLVTPKSLPFRNDNPISALDSEGLSRFKLDTKN